MKLRVALAAVVLSTAVAIPANAKPALGSYQDDVLGISLGYPSDKQVVRDEYLLDEEYGFTVKMPTGRDGEHAEPMVLRVVLLHRETPGTLETVVQRFVDSFPGIPIQRSELVVAGQRAIMLENAPGLVTTTYVFTEVDGRMIEFIYPRAALDAEGKALLGTVHFKAPSRTVESLQLTRAADMLFMAPMGETWAPVKPLSAEGPRSFAELYSAPITIAACANWPTTKYMQTPIDTDANGNGYTWAGPSFYGEGLHTGCSNTSSQNDNYAVDMSLRLGDRVLPIASGTVVWAGWASGGWSTLGRTVIIDHGGGYKSLSAHLNGINVASGAAVGNSTVIGWAGGSGNGSNNYWSPHLHSAPYLNASVSGGGTYGGQSAQPLNIHWCRSGCTNYYPSYSKGQTISY
jgi:hypothetical protein